MTSGNQNNKPLLAIILATIPVIGLVIGAFLNNLDKINEIFGKDSPDETGEGIKINTDKTEPIVNNPAKEIESETPKKSRENTEAPANKTIQKIKIDSANVENNNEYSSRNDSKKMFDGNNKTYWSTKMGAVTDVVINFSFAEPKTLNEIKLLAPVSNSSYGSWTKVTLKFFDNSGKEISQQTIEVNDSDSWQKLNFEEVSNVVDVKLEIDDPREKTYSYRTIHEIEFYGY